MLQVLQNKAARSVTKLPWRTSTDTLLSQCGWLSVKQLVKFHSLVLLFKVKTDKKPVYIFNHIGTQAGRNTRQEADRISANFLKDARNLETGTARKTFIPRTVDDWNELPDEIRAAVSQQVFKRKLRTWVQGNVPLK